MKCALVLPFGWLWTMALAGCGTQTTTCQLITEVAPQITVTDAVTGAPICDGTVVASLEDGGATLTLGTLVPPDAASSLCLYFVLFPLADGGEALAGFPEDGEYSLNVSKGGFQSVTVQGVATRQSAPCGAVPAAQQVNVMLQPD
jgi:hypothetical protein